MPYKKGAFHTHRPHQHGWHVFISFRRKSLHGQRRPFLELRSQRHTDLADLLLYNGDRGRDQTSQTSNHNFYDRSLWISDEWTANVFFGRLEDVPDSHVRHTECGGAVVAYIFYSIDCL